MESNTIPALLAAHASSYARKDAVVDRDGRISYAELERESANRAAALVQAGVNKGHRVGLMMPNAVEWAVQAHAIMRIGAVLVPLSTMLRLPELEAQLRIGGIRHLIAAPHFRGRDYRAELNGMNRSVLPSLANLWWSNESLPAGGDAAQDVAAALAASVKPADEMAVIFTSGSSGDPKGVIHTHGAALRANRAGHDVRRVGPDSRLYLPMPLFWAGGFSTGLISALNAGCTLLTEAIAEPAETLRFLAREKATLFRGWPDQGERLAAHPDFAQTDLSSLQPGSLDAVLPDKSPPPGARANLIGMTETFGPYCGYRLDRELPPGKWGSCGFPLDGIRMRVTDPDSGAVLETDREGSIQIGGPNILKGICGREREDVFTVDGWFDTGDMGHLDADGYLFFSGRRDEMVKIGGASAYPAEVESALCSLPEIRTAAVCAINMAGETRFGAALVTQDRQLNIADLAAGAQQALSAFKVPKLWLVLDSPDDLPRKTSGKIDKAALRALIEKDGTAA